MKTHDLSYFRRGVIGLSAGFEGPYGWKKILYADWTASGRGYAPIERRLQEEILPFYGNTHTESTVTGRRMSEAYAAAKETIKRHVHAKADDVLLFCGSGMTAAVNKLQRIVGMRQQTNRDVPEHERPLVLVTHMEHHSNYISWLETNGTVEIIRPDENGNVDLVHLGFLLKKYATRKIKLAAVTACSNVTGIETPVKAIAAQLHAHGGYCFVDYACSAPYVNIDMQAFGLDAIYFSFHKFLGGPGTPGVLIFNQSLYKWTAPDQPGGGTILYANPWKEYDYLSSIEEREDGGTPPILQAIKAAMCIELKEEMGIDRMLSREREIVARMLDRLSGIEGLEVLAPNQRERLGIISFVVTEVRYDRFVGMLNDRFGIQARGGCSCAGPYGHYLLGIDPGQSQAIRNELKAGDLSAKPGWVRLSIHPIMTDAEIEFILDAVEVTARQYQGMIL